jgi:hypothetical protein
LASLARTTSLAGLTGLTPLPGLGLLTRLTGLGLLTLMRFPAMALKFFFVVHGLTASLALKFLFVLIHGKIRSF